LSKGSLIDANLLVERRFSMTSQGWKRCWSTGENAVANGSVCWSASGWGDP